MRRLREAIPWPQALWEEGAGLLWATFPFGMTFSQLNCNFPLFHSDMAIYASNAEIHAVVKCSKRWAKLGASNVSPAHFAIRKWNKSWFKMEIWFKNDNKFQNKILWIWHETNMQKMLRQIPARIEEEDQRQSAGEGRGNIAEKVGESSAGTPQIKIAWTKMRRNGRKKLDERREE